VTTRRAFFGTLAGGLLAPPLAAGAQPAAKVTWVGFLGTTLSPTLEAFTDGLRQLGWVEGQNLIIERRFSEGRQERFRELAAEPVRLEVDVIVTSGTPASCRQGGDHDRSDRDGGRHRSGCEFGMSMSTLKARQDRAHRLCCKRGGKLRRLPLSPARMGEWLRAYTSMWLLSCDLRDDGREGYVAGEVPALIKGGYAVLQR
jgi:hypothetical protein